MRRRNDPAVWRPTVDRENGVAWRRLSGISLGLAVVFVLALQFTGCANNGTHRTSWGGSARGYEATVKRLPDLARVAEAYDLTAAPAGEEAERMRQLNLFAEVFQITQSDYVDTVAPDRLIDTAVASIQQRANTDPEIGDRAPAKLMALAMSDMLHDLDPHSDYMTPESYDAMRIRTRGEFGGLGIEVTMEDGLIKVVSPIDETPAFRAGVESGDFITHVDGEAILGRTLSEAVERMRGPVGSKVTITVRREAVAEPFDLDIVRDIVRIRAVRSHAEGDVGYIRITTFNERTMMGLEKAVESLRAEIGDDLSGFVIDLRNNPGGLLDQALDVTDAFITSGEIVSTSGRNRKQVRRFVADAADISGGLPLMVLINGGSASASEIVSGALQDHGRATILGSRSFGKGSVQTIIPVRNGGAVRLTTARYYTPAGRSIQLTGIEPDIVANTVEDEGPLRREADLDHALPAEGQSIAGDGKDLETYCPGSASEEDPVLTCALQLLHGGQTMAATPGNTAN